MQKSAFLRRALRKAKPFSRTFAIIFVLAVSLLMQNVQLAQALSPAQKRALDREIKYFDTENCSVGSSGGGVVSVTGPAAEVLKKVGMDPGWINLIVKYATQYQTDPIAMATLMYWENRRFPPFPASDDTTSELLPRDEAYSRNADGAGRGPWQFIRPTWEGLARKHEIGAYRPNVYSAEKSTMAAAIYVKSEGGGAGNPLGFIGQDFGQGSNIPSMATVAKNYNAGPATYRNPAVAEWRQPGRSWISWGDTKARIIDDYVVGVTFAYYQIATGVVPTYKNDEQYLQEALQNQNQVKQFKFTDSGASATPGAPAAPNTPNSSTQSVIVLDPGHAVDSDVDTVKLESGKEIAVFDYDNGQETKDAWYVAQEAKKQLEAAGYKVLLTKQNEAGTDSAGKPNTNLKQRADVAAQADAAVGISIHTTPGAASFANVNFVPKAGNWRAVANAKPTNGNPNNPTFAESDKVGYYQGKEAIDAQYAETFRQTRSNAMGGAPVQVKSYEEWSGGPRVTTQGGITSAGTVLVTQFFASTPWVYMEQAQDAGTGLTQKSKDAYIKGIVEGVKKAIPVTGAGGGDASASCPSGPTVATGGQGGVVQTALNLAWPEPYGKHDPAKEPTRTSAITPRDEYKKAVQAYNKAVGSSDITIADCGIFVATVMRASGADPDYPGVYTPTQEKYLRSNPNKYQILEKGKPGYPSSPNELVPGDILIINANGGAGANGHTMLYIGKQANGYDLASASYMSRSANLSMAYLSDNRGFYTIARLKQ